MMKRLVLAAMSALFIAGAGAVGAQTVIITEEQQPMVRDYIIQRQVAPAEIPSDFELSVGATVPDAIELHPLDMPEIQTQTQYRYVVVDNRTLIVDPQTRQVVQIIE